MCKNRTRNAMLLNRYDCYESHTTMCMCICIYFAVLQACSTTPFRHPHDNVKVGLKVSAQSADFVYGSHHQAQDVRPWTRNSESWHSRDVHTDLVASTKLFQRSRKPIIAQLPLTLSPKPSERPVQSPMQPSRKSRKRQSSGSGVVARTQSLCFRLKL